MSNAAAMNKAAPPPQDALQMYAASETDAADYVDKKSELRMSYNSEGHNSAPEGDNDMQLQLYNDCFAFSGMYDDVSYPITTLFCPPHPPGELPPRVQLPPRPGPLWLNDVEAAGELEHNAQTRVSKVWRGILSRRNLRNSRTYEHILNYRARTIQCWWRTMAARQRRQNLEQLKREWWMGRGQSYIEGRKQVLVMNLTWQKRKFEGAAITIQRVVRWFMRKAVIANCKMEGVPQEEWPEELPMPVETPMRPYFPWRRRRTSGAMGTLQGLSPTAFDNKNGDNNDNAIVISDDGAQRRRTILEFKKVKSPVEPPKQDAVEEENQKMRVRSRSRVMSLAAPEVQSRQEWKKENMRKEDLDFNAGVVQRAIQARRSASKVRTVEITHNYMSNMVRIIIRSFRIYTLVQRLKSKRFSMQRQVQDRLNRYSKNKIAEIQHKLIWGKGLLDACATTIQRCWHWYRYNRYGVLPLRIQNELNRCRGIREHKQAEAERSAREREELKARLMAELGMDAEVKASENAYPTESAETPVVDEEMAVEKVAEEPAQFEEEKEEEDGEYVYELPQPPRYNLIDDFLAREEELRDAMMNLLERNKKEMTKKRKYTPYVPEKIVERKHVNVYVKS